METSTIKTGDTYMGRMLNIFFEDGNKQAGVVTAIATPRGYGKTYNALEYQKTHPDVFYYVACCVNDTELTIVQKMINQVGGYKAITPKDREGVITAEENYRYFIEYVAKLYADKLTAHPDPSNELAELFSTFVFDEFALLEHNVIKFITERLYEDIGDYSSFILLGRFPELSNKISEIAHNSPHDAAGFNANVTCHVYEPDILGEISNICLDNGNPDMDAFYKANGMELMDTDEKLRNIESLGNLHAMPGLMEKYYSSLAQDDTDVADDDEPDFMELHLGERIASLNEQRDAVVAKQKLETEGSRVYMECDTLAAKMCDIVFELKEVLSFYKKHKK